MTARTEADVEDRLDAELVWRRLEMLTLIREMTAAERQSPGSPLSRALARSCVALIYAHWEGFVRESCQTYVDFLAKRRLKYGELSDALLQTALRSLAKRVTAGDEDSGITLLDAVRRPQSTWWSISRSTATVNTKSNLRYATFCEILRSVGMSTDKFEIKRNFIDKALCDVRNEVAHGRELFPDPRRIETMHSEVIEMMETVRDMIIASIRSQDYRLHQNENH